MTPAPSFTDVPDHELLHAAKRLAANERQATAQLIACLAELDARHLYLGEGCSSLFTYCTQVLHLSEHAAYGRIEAARAVRRFPGVLALLAGGDLTLTAVCLLRPHLTQENHRELLASARHKSKRDVEQLVAAIQPKPEVRSLVRKLREPPGVPAPTPQSSPSFDLSAHGGASSERSRTAIAAIAAPVATQTPTRASVVAPLAPERYKVQFTIGHDTHEKLRRAQDLLRHSIPNGDPAEVFDRALSVLLQHLENTKLARANRPRAVRRTASRSRRIPAAVRRAVWVRDGGQCAFRGAEGRCTERGFLEFHHLVPYARGGAATTENIEIRCRAHNRYEAEIAFGQQCSAVRERSPQYDATELGPGQVSEGCRTRGPEHSGTQPVARSRIPRAGPHLCLRRARNSRSRACVHAQLRPPDRRKRRVFVGHDKEGAARVVLMDRDGKPRILLQVAADGSPSLSFLDVNGNVVNEFGLKRPH